MRIGTLVSSHWSTFLAYALVVSAVSVAVTAVYGEVSYLVAGGIVLLTYLVMDRLMARWLTGSWLGEPDDVFRSDEEIIEDVLDET